ncbi:MAG: O-antigen ligase family protein, partial [Gammaproteobacteria bacterium]|nr:O-antigen ligase family protein [Gammaproteobacteria bacterium]
MTGIALFYIMLRPELLRGPLWKHPITILLLLHILWALITTIGASHVVVSLKYMAAKIWFSCVFFFLTLYIIRDRRQFRLLFWLLFLPTLG